MKRLWPAPPLTLFLLAFWLWLNNTLDPGHVVLGALLGSVVPWVTERLRPDKARIKHPVLVLRLALMVLKDIVAANLEVARHILRAESNLQSKFIHVPLALRDPSAIAALLGIISLTPGTLSAELSADRLCLLVHALHAPDEASLIATIKTRYEAPIKEIFE